MCYQFGGCVISLCADVLSVCADVLSVWGMCYQFARGCVISLCADVLSVWGMCYQVGGRDFSNLPNNFNSNFTFDLFEWSRGSSVLVHSTSIGTLVYGPPDVQTLNRVSGSLYFSIILHYKFVG